MMTSILRLSKLKSVTTAVILALSSHGLHAESLNAGITAYQEKQFSKALGIFQQYAKKGNPTAQFYLSLLYRSGMGVERDEDEAFDWCKKSAGEGVLDAQFQLGIMYLQGEGVEEDDVLALEWLWQASDRGHLHAREVLQFVLQNDFTTGC
jgi:TPR repeat protein